MQLIPAIDIRHGCCVRLLRGDFDQETRYELDPTELASAYHAAGAVWLHIVDLDGAATGKPANGELIRRIAAAADLRIQLGGGIRSESDLQTVLGYADRAVIGSLAVSEPALVSRWIGEAGPERIVLGLDVRLGEDGQPRITTHGWTEASTMTLADAIELYREAGLRHVLCTDVAKDGAMTGPNFVLYEECARRWPDIAFQASGGVRDAADLDRLAATGVAAAISGKALLEQRITPAEMKPFLPNA